MKNSRTKQIGIFALLMSAMAMYIAGCEKDTQSLLIGQWEVVESSLDDIILSSGAKEEYFADGTGISEVNIETLGQVTVSFTWKIDSEGRLVIVSQDIAQIYTIVEISKSALVLEGDIPNYGKMRTKYSKRKKGEKSALTDGIAPKQVKEQSDSKSYKSVEMPDGKIWMAENLNYNTDGSKCYVDETQNCDKYGRLYNWETAKKVCPSGWHLPSDAEWDKLINAVGGKETAGKHLKAKNGWGDYEGQVGNGKDTYGFSALPGGANCPSFGSIFDIGVEGIWWSATEKNAGNAYYRSISYSSNFSGMYKHDDDKECWFSVRCIKD
ncbi:MAG: fibrobacter succinogenes major paralogous domain-containing protein [Fibromonadaceae bacterium]|jgi:uncharacterized protein (TIGR02145 family)|nr:fibrobacter succinogenes major paralogous domain-containing protein [Fibromonadaceae bacterium]